MIIRHLPTGPLAVNCYIIGDPATKLAVVVDPGGNVPNILKVLEQDGLTCRTIFNTHSHFDHTGGNAELKSATGAEIVTHPKEAPFLEGSDTAARLFGLRAMPSPPADRTLVEGDILQVGELKGQLLELPGHSPCGLAILFDGHVFVGDALFNAGIGRTDFPGGSFEALITAIREKLFTLPDETIVYPGHGPTTTIGHEKKFNPWLQ